MATTSSTRVLELMMCEIRNDASSLKNWFIPGTPYNLKFPEPLPMVFSQVFMMNAYQAGAPAGGSGGSGIQAQSADVMGLTPS
eukprot:5071681-Pyramimonas_sp.AAC.1